MTYLSIIGAAEVGMKALCRTAVRDDWLHGEQLFSHASITSTIYHRMATLINPPVKLIEYHVTDFQFYLPE